MNKFIQLRLYGDPHTGRTQIIMEDSKNITFNKKGEMKKMTELTKKEQLKKVFKTILHSYLCTSIHRRNKPDYDDEEIDEISDELLKEVSIRAALK